MKALVASLASALVVAAGLANGQQSSWRDSMVPQRSDATTVTPSTKSVPTTDNWLVSETTSPLDYTPVAIATTPAGNENDLQLSIQCRGGKTDLVITSAAMTRNVDEYRVSYRVNGSVPAALAVVAPPTGTGVAVKDDVVRLLAKLSVSGTVSFAVATREGNVLEGRYGLEALSAVRKRLAVPCKWPLITAPN